MPGKAITNATGVSTERVMIFIDGSNLYHVLSENCERHDLVFSKFAEKLLHDRRLVRTYYYNIRQNPTVNPQANAEQERFLQTLFDTPLLEVRLGVHRRHGDTMVEKGVDVMLATDLVVGALHDLYDSAIVVSGDGDFYPAMQVAKDHGKHVEVVAFANNLSPEARRVADTSLILTKSYFAGLWTDRRKTRGSSSGTQPITDKNRSRRRNNSVKSSPPSSQASVSSENVATHSKPVASRKNGANTTPAVPDGSSHSGRRNRRRRLVSVTGTANSTADSNSTNSPSDLGKKTQENVVPDTGSSSRVGWFRRRRTRPSGGSKE